MTEHERLVLSLVAERHRGMPRWHIRPPAPVVDTDLECARRRRVLELAVQEERRTA